MNIKDTAILIIDIQKEFLVYYLIQLLDIFQKVSKNIY